MKIVYWSPVHGQAGTTSNILATALITGMVYKKRCLLTQTHFNFNNLEAPLVGSNSKNAASFEYFRDVGIDALVRSFKAAKLNKEVLENCCISLPNTNVSLLPGTSKNNKDSFEYEMDAVFLNLMRTIEDIMGVVFVDVSSGNNPLSFKIMNDSDLVVINLSQNMGMTDAFFTYYIELIHSKVFYLFGNYDGNSKYNINNIRRRYWKSITPMNSGVIPYNTAYLDAQCDGRVNEFIRENMGCGKNDQNQYFIKKVRKATEKIVKLAGININNEGGT